MRNLIEIHLVVSKMNHAQRWGGDIPSFSKCFLRVSSSNTRKRNQKPLGFKYSDQVTVLQTNLDIWLNRETFFVRKERVIRTLVKIIMKI
jgi:hypothetical protein